MQPCICSILGIWQLYYPLTRRVEVFLREAKYTYLSRLVVEPYAVD